jgi:hypothetical protein
MIPLAIGIAILDEHARLTHLQTNDAPLLLTALSTVGVDLIHLFCVVGRCGGMVDESSSRQMGRRDGRG